MKKTLVAIAAAAAVTGAMAEVTITGHLDQGLTGESGKVSGVTSYTYSGLASIDAPSFIVFAGSEDLGSGLKAGFHIENGLNINSSSLLSETVTNWNDGQSGNNRETWVSLNGEFGDIKLGRQYSPLFFTVLANDPGGLNNAPGVLAAGQMGGTGAGSTWTGYSSTTYTTPSISGISFSAQVQSGTGNSATATSGNGFGYSLTYAGGPLNASVAYNSYATTSTATLFTGGSTTLGTTRFASVTTTAGDAYTATAIGASYDFGMAKVSYLNTQTALNSYSSNFNMAGITVPFGAASLAFSYSTGNASITSSTTVSQTGQQLIGYYNFSKHTKAYLIYGNAKDSTSNDSITMTSIGIGHNF